MIHKHHGRPGGGWGVRGLAVLAAAPLLGVVPLPGAGAPATADGPVQARDRRDHEPAGHRSGKARAKKRTKPGKTGHPVRAVRGARSRAATVRIDTAGPGVPLVPGRVYTWPFSVTGKGPSRNAPATLTAELPRSLEFVSGTRDCSYVPASGDAMGRVVCELGAVRSGETEKGALTAKVAKNAQPGNHVVGTASVSWAGARASRAFPAATVADIADVSVAGRAPAVIRPGEAIPYAIEVRNEGPSPARQVTVTSAMPAEIADRDGACTATGRRLVCVVDRLSAGGTRTFHARVRPRQRPRPGTVLEAPSRVATTTAELNLDNNRATARTKVLRPQLTPVSRPLVTPERVRPGAAPDRRPAAKVRRAGVPAGPARPSVPSVPSAGGTAPAPTRTLRELPRTGAETGVMLDLSLGLVGTGLILTRLGRARRREQD
ncbi:DUF11 domain-containing protein [Actinomadura kijaniata]|uniref:DUF11 domain-containing protein n=1 Tax=Actinomadura kijaniata TaxID=46161 RepID=UPI00083766BC|nr:DUF11 domain-containing protein [Actinomadura kijaniata]